MCVCDGWKRAECSKGRTNSILHSRKWWNTRLHCDTVHDVKDEAGGPSSERKQCEWNNIDTTCRIDTACGDGSDSCRAIVWRHMEILWHHIVSVSEVIVTWNILSGRCWCQRLHFRVRHWAALAYPEVCLHSGQALRCLRVRGMLQILRVIKT